MIHSSDYSEKQNYVSKRWPKVEGRLFEAMVRLQDHNPEFTKSVKVYDHLDWQQQQKKLDNIKTAIHVAKSKA